MAQQTLLSARYRDKVWLRMKKKPKLTDNHLIRTVDLFAGCGGLSVGMMEACRRLKLGHKIELANEWDEKVLAIFEENLDPTLAICGNVSELFNGKYNSSKMTTAEKNLIDKYPDILEPDILTGGPPCQGHSNLNNHSRRKDPRNNLYYRMVRAARILKPKAIIIENVSAVIHSKERVVQNSEEMLKKMGYYIESITILANEFGVPQKRRRHFLFASRVSKPDLSILEQYRMSESRTLHWAIGDIQREYNAEDLFNQPAKSSPENQARMDWLIDNNEWNLPNHLRPRCHKNGHTYPSVYGRMKWDEPSPTITAGFRCNGRGRFTHPSAKPGRPLTPHEAARIQTFPDWFSFEGHNLTTMTKAIGNAVPPLLAMHVANIAIKALGND
jgi:DNA (cytosine-5)-methyltransferase 1